MKNLQIEVEEIVFRFEDDISYPGCLFAGGATIKKIQIMSTGEDFQIKPDKLVPDHEKAFNVINLEGFSFYLDYNDNTETNMFRSMIDSEVKESLADRAEYFKESLDFSATVSLKFRSTVKTPSLIVTFCLT